MIVSIHQPAYLPWLGYFEKIARADVFVYLDTVQFEKNSFINRNRIKTPQGPQWLTIPVLTKGHTEGTLRHTEVDDRQPWREKHLKSIAMNYRKAPYFGKYYPEMEKLLRFPENRLSELCWQQLQYWIADLGIKTRLVRASEMDVVSRKSDLVLDICVTLGATKYISGALGRGYLVESDFATAGIEVDYQDYHHPVYSQAHGDFSPYMSVLDLVLNMGPASTDVIMSGN